jgi:hypothetical protein
VARSREQIRQELEKDPESDFSTLTPEQQERRIDLILLDEPE